MLTFKSKDDLQKLDEDHPAYPLIKKLVKLLIEDYTWDGHPYLPEDYGYLVLIEKGDTDRVLEELQMCWRLSEIPWESVSRVDGYIYAVYQGTDEFGMGFLIPDAEWVRGELRSTLDEILDPAPLCFT